MQNLEMRIDWEAYFKSFVETHGADPITDPSGNYLLFQDGWRYHSSRVSGPEFPPDDKKHANHIKTLYWTLRKKKAEHERSQLVERINSYMETQSMLSGTLHVHTRIFDEDTEREVNVSRPVDFELLHARAEWLRRDIQDAAVKLKAIQKDEDDGS
tara:strand:+ start:44592 stop:45059 length:468 start_codon:yes stop_codon:yes gene_type:complete